MIKSFAFLGLLVLFIIACFAEAYVIQHLWNWYLVNSYGILSYTSALGITLIGGLVFSETPVLEHLNEQQRLKYHITSMINVFIVQGLIFVIGFILKP